MVLIDLSQPKNLALHSDFNFHWNGYLNLCWQITIQRWVVLVCRNLLILSFASNARYLEESVAVHLATSKRECRCNLKVARHRTQQADQQDNNKPMDAGWKFPEIFASNSIARVKINAKSRSNNCIGMKSNFESIRRLLVAQTLKVSLRMASASFSITAIESEIRSVVKTRNVNDV